MATRQAVEPNPFGWALLLALVLWLLLVAVFGHLLLEPDVVPPTELPPIDARLVELPEPPKPEPPPPPPPPVPRPVVKTVAKPVTPPPVTQRAPAPQPQKQVPAERPLETAPDVPEQKSSPDANALPVPAAPVAPPVAPIQKPSSAPSSATGAGTENMAAKAIYQPLPKIPENLIGDVINSTAMVKFSIRADGTVAEVELLKPTTNPRINQSIISTLKTWKFFPAMKEGKPAATTQELRVNIDVS
jgi:periplasmic protein TonB